MTTTDRRIPEEEFPEGKIVLCNGTMLDCTPKVPDPIVEERPDVYFEFREHEVKMHNRSKVDKKKLKKIEEEQLQRSLEKRNLFVENAYFLLDHAAEVFADSRMFLAPVPFHNGLYYSGSAQFENPTLGIYLEWWMNGPESNHQDSEGREMLVTSFAGSPLSGCNRCCCAYRDGERGVTSIGPFKALWQSFITYNQRYKASKKRYDAYDIGRVVEILKANGAEEKLRLELDWTNDRMRRATAQLEREHAMAERYRGAYAESQMLLHGDEIVHFHEEMDHLVAQKNERLGFLEGLLDNLRREYQARTVTMEELKKMKSFIYRKLNQELQEMEERYDSEVRRLMEEYGFTYGQIVGEKTDGKPLAPANGGDKALSFVKPPKGK